ncbi:hypothetical protein HZC53_01045 [Candidatus Uhrbacteria bacterium]|nr:hypothetical protein [Candidatus Uhrbacteria bacterium]
MSNTPKPDSHDSGQVRSLTQRRAEKEGTFRPTIYDVSYVKGERITCTDQYVAYLVRAGSVRAKKEMDTQSGRNLVTVDFIEQGEPLLVSRFIPNVKDDREIQFYAETDCIIGEFPIHSISAMFDAREFLRSFSQSSAEHTQRLREALFKQLARNQKLLEESRNLNLELGELQRTTAQRQKEASDGVVDEIIGLQLQIGELQRGQDEAKKALTKAEHEVARAKADLKVVRERERNAIAKAREAFDYFQSLEQRQREESLQFPDMVNRVLAHFDIPPLGVEDLMFIITSAASRDTVRQEAGSVAQPATEDEGLKLIIGDSNEAAPVIQVEPTWADGESFDLDVAEDSASQEEAPTVPRPRMMTIGFEEETLAVRPPDSQSGYCLMGDQIAQDGIILIPEEDEGDRHTPTVPPPDAILARIETQAMAKPKVKAAPLPYTGRAPRPNPPAPKQEPPQPPPSGSFGIEEVTTSNMAPVSCPTATEWGVPDELLSTTATWDVRDPKNPKPMKK